MRSRTHRQIVSSLVNSIKACAEKKDLLAGSRLYADIHNRGLLAKSPHLGSTLVSMYAKCGALSQARQVLNEMPAQNVVSWSALISGYAQHGDGLKALHCYEEMCSKGFSPNAITYSCILKACGITRDAHKGKLIHDEIVQQGLLEKDVVLGNALIDMYSKCGVLEKAQKIFNELPARNVISWSILITGCAQHGQGKEALRYYERMQSEGVSPNAITYSSILKVCGMAKEADKGKQIHDEIVSRGLSDKDVVLGTALVDMYAKCGLLKQAQDIFDRLPLRNLVSWNALIAGYVQQGKGVQALNCYKRMQMQRTPPNAITYSCILKACGITRDADMGKQIHDEIICHELLGENLVLGNALIDMYCRCDALMNAQEAFDELPVRDLVSWNALIAGYTKQGQGKEALDCFEWMKSEGISPDAITYACILKACGITREADKGREIHEELTSRMLLGQYVVLGNALVDMYGRCGALLKAQEVFDELLLRNLVSWNCLISVYIQQGQVRGALNCFDQMRVAGISPDAITYSCILKACSIARQPDRGKKIHDEIVSERLLEKSIVLGTALVDMYAKCGLTTKAQEVFDRLPLRDLISWSALIGGYAQQGLAEEALNCYEQMPSKGVPSNAITYLCLLKACGITRELDRGMRIHNEIVNQGLLGKDVLLGTAVVDMYAKCGVMTKAQETFDQLPARSLVSWNALIAGYVEERQSTNALNCFQQMRSEGLTPDVASWNALIAGYAQQGLVEEALTYFHQMHSESTNPDAITFVFMLSACSHSGRLKEGQMYFEMMSKKYGITPSEEHHACMVDLCSRAGHFDKALDIIKNMPSSKYPPAWSALMGACRKWENVKLGRLAFEHAVRLDRHDAAAHTRWLMSGGT